MEPDKNTTPQPENNQPDNEAPADALSRTPDDLEQEQHEREAAAATTSSHPVEKKPSTVRRILRRLNVYFLFFLLVIVVAGIVTAINYFNSQKVAPEATIPTQKLSEDALKQLANTDASVGSKSQTLTIQGNAIIAGQTLMRGNLNVAGNFQSAGPIQGPSLRISGDTNLGSTQINSLQVAQNTAIQGNTTLRDLNVAGSASFSGAVTASQLTVTRLILSGNAVLQVPNHISFAGPAPTRTINTGPLGSGGTASVSGSDTTGTVNINTGSGTVAGCFVRINFSQSFGGQPHVMISPVGAGAGLTQYYVDRDASGFSICASSPAPGNQAFAFDYFVTS